MKSGGLSVEDGSSAGGAVGGPAWPSTGRSPNLVAGVKVAPKERNKHYKKDSGH